MFIEQWDPRTAEPTNRAVNASGGPAHAERLELGADSVRLQGRRPTALWRYVGLARRRPDAEVHSSDRLKQETGIRRSQPDDLIENWQRKLRGAGLGIIVGDYTMMCV